MSEGRPTRRSRSASPTLGIVVILGGLALLYLIFTGPTTEPEAVDAPQLDEYGRPLPVE